MYIYIYNLKKLSDNMRKLKNMTKIKKRIDKKKQI